MFLGSLLFAFLNVTSHLLLSTKYLLVYLCICLRYFMNYNESSQVVEVAMQTIYFRVNAFGREKDKVDFFIFAFVRSLLGREHNTTMYIDLCFG